MRRRFFSNKTVEKIDLSKNYFKIEALEDGLTSKLTINTCEYCIDDGSWIKLPPSENTIPINKGQILSFRGNLQSSISSRVGTFTISKKCNLKGNIMSLLHKDDFEEQTDLVGKSYAFSELFYNCTNIVDASELILPATTLADGCYSDMFRGCTSLTQAPELPATTLADGCYQYMFYDCTSLVSAPELPATTLVRNCYQYMFDGCTSLVSAPELPATTLVKNCYQYMFYDCTSLVSAPELPATTLADRCYYNMFNGCTSLTTAPALPATTLAALCYYRMFTYCESLTQAPELPATTLADRCYYEMFNCCTKLNYIKALFTTTPSNTNTYTHNWVYGVSSTGTFIKNKNATWNVTGNNGIPSGWTVQTA